MSLKLFLLLCIIYNSFFKLAPAKRLKKYVITVFFFAKWTINHSVVCE